MKYIVGNWKSNHNLATGVEFLTQLHELEASQPRLKDIEQEIVICPPFPLLGQLNEENNRLGLDLKFGVQNLSSYPAGAYTGEVCTQNLADLGVQYVILGHSERRRYLEETSVQIGAKVTQALIAGLKPILCVDEPYLQEQADTLDSSQFEQIIIAFEPLSAIGTGQSLSSESVAPVIEKIKKTYSAQTPVLYGGSVTGETVSSYLDICDGVLVGGASLTATSFRQLYM